MAKVKLVKVSSTIANAISAAYGDVVGLRFALENAGFSWRALKADIRKREAEAKRNKSEGKA